MQQQTILAEIYRWEESHEISYYGWRIKGEYGNTISGCSGYQTAFEALQAMNRHEDTLINDRALADIATPF